VGLFKWKRRRKAETKAQEKIPTEWIRYPHLPPRAEGPGKKYDKKDPKQYIRYPHLPPSKW